MKKLKIIGIVLVVLVVLGIIGNIIGTDDDNSTASSSASTTETVAAAPTDAATEASTQAEEESSPIVLTAGELGEYGTAEKLENDDMVKEYIAYRVPAGIYTITNIGKNMTQVTIYKDGAEKNEDGIMEQIMSDTRPLLIDVNASKELTIKDGEYISIVEPDVIELRAK